MRYLILTIACFGIILGCRSLGQKEESKEANVTPIAERQDKKDVFRLSAVEENPERNLGVLNLGRMSSGEVVVGNIYIENGFNAPLVLLGVNASCGCLSFEYDKSPVKVGEKRKIEYRYDSKTKSGKQYSTVSIKTSEGGYELKTECDVN